MAIKLFGFEITSKKEREEQKQIQNQAYTTVENSEESIEVSPLGGYGGSVYGINIDIDGSIKNENQQISLYRNMSMYPECDYAIDDIVNEAIVSTDNKYPVQIDLDQTEFSKSIKAKIIEEFDTVLSLLDFNNRAYDVFRRWYVDGRLYYHVIINKNNVRDGIQELRYIDPRKIRRIKEEKKKSQQTPAKKPLAKEYNEYYIYNPKGLSAKETKQAVPLALDSVTYVHSGLIDSQRKMVVSNLHKAIRPWNQLKLLEDASVIYRISRAPERRVFYVDVGNLPKGKAEQYLQSIMTRFKNKVTYNAVTGEVQDNVQHRTMLEDFWLPRREGGKGTEVSTLAGGQNLGEIEDILFFRRKLYQALNVPRTRIEADTGFSIGRDTEITRDEVKFGKMISRLRLRFSMLFTDLLEKQLILRGVMTPTDWDQNKGDIRFNWDQDTFFIELQEGEIFKNRIEIMQQAEQFSGTFLSAEWLWKNILRFTEEEISEIKKQIKAEEKSDPDIHHQDEDEVPVEPPASAAPKSKNEDVVAEPNPLLEKLNELLDNELED